MPGVYGYYGYGYNPNPYAYSYLPPARNGSVVDGMAQYHRVYVNPNTMAGLPPDTFHRSRNLVSSRYTQPVSEWKLFAKDLGNLASDIGTIAQVAGIFYPPAAVAAAVIQPYTSAAGFAGGFIDTTPKPVVVASYSRYNPWFR